MLSILCYLLEHFLVFEQDTANLSHRANLSAKAADTVIDTDPDNLEIIRQIIEKWLDYIDSLTDKTKFTYSGTRILSPAEQHLLTEAAQQQFYQAVNAGLLDANTAERILLACLLHEQPYIDSPVLESMIALEQLNPHLPVSLLFSSAQAVAIQNTEQRVIH